MVKVLFVSRIDPLPPRGGEEIRAWHLVSGLACNHQVDAVSFTDGGELDERSLDAERVLTHWTRVPRPAVSDLRARLLAYPRLVPKFVVWHRSDEFQRALEAANEKHAYDIVHVFGLAMAQYVPGLLSHQRPVVLDLMDSWGVLYRRYAANSRGLSRTAFRIRARIVERFERRAIDLGTELVVLSDEDRTVLVKAGADPTRVTAIPNGVDAAGYFSPAGGAGDHSDTLVFVGDMAYRANIEGVVWFAKHVLPSVVAARPQVKVWIVGKNPAPEIRRLAGAHVEVTGYVDDVRPYLEAASIAIAPILSGAGIKNKVLEAMAFARPVVTTPVGGEGIPIDDGIHGFVRSTPEGFAQIIVELLDNPQLRGRAGSAARQLVIERARWDLAVERLLEVYERAV